MTQHMGPLAPLMLGLLAVVMAMLSAHDAQGAQHAARKAPRRAPVY